MKEKLEILFTSLDRSLDGACFIEPFYVDGFPSHPAIYRSNNVHAFYRFDENPTKAIYLKGFSEQSTESEAHVLAKLIEEEGRWDVQQQIDAKRMKPPGLKLQDIEDIMSLLDKYAILPNFGEEGVKIPYDTRLLGRMIVANLPTDKYGVNPRLLENVSLLK